MSTKFLDSPGYYIEPNIENPLPDRIQDLKDQGIDLVVNDTPAKLNAERTLGGGSEYRPLTYKELDENFINLYPVGSVYMNADDGRNPRVILGFGVWERISGGRSFIGVDSSSDSAFELSHKIVSAYKENNIVTIKLKNRMDSLKKRFMDDNPNYKTNLIEGDRQFNFYPGLKVNIKGLKKPDGGNGPTGNFTIQSVDSDKGVKTKAADISELSKIGWDQNIIRIRYNSDPEFQGEYNVKGSNDSEADNAYCVALDSETVSGGDKGGTSFADINVIQIPPHEHGFGSIHEKNGYGGQTGWWDRHGNSKLGGNSNQRYDIDKGNYTLPSGTSYQGMPSRGNTNVSWAQRSGVGNVEEFSENNIRHQNKQPFVGVHVWERIG